MKLDFIGFGALNVDRLYRVDRIIGKSEETYIKDYFESPGGSAANTIVGLSRLGKKTGYIGKVSGDREGEILLQSLSKENVDIKGLIRSEEGRSGVVIGFIDKLGERALYVDPGVNNTLKYAEIDLDYARNAEFIHLTSFVGNIPFRAQKTLLTNLNGVKISFDPGEIYARRNFEALNPIIQRSHVVFLTKKELKLLTGMDYKSGASFLIKKGVRIVAVKLGKNGCYITDSKEKYVIEPYKVKVMDTTGAGDAFCAGFLYGLIENKNIYTCGKLGNLVASFCIKHVGAREGLPRRLDIS
jgi:ribokinase